ncbi:MAG: sigma-70 family RNA polymerase sigma factor [Actinomycetota bacterium]|nr:sigma-70 family RNA polymerase sigma factor [Actinomycetota bacterium]
MTELDALAERARRGDAAALELLLERSQADLRRFASRVCASADAEDAVQHALVVIYTRIGAFRAAARFTTWVFSIVHNECARLLRRSARFVSLEVHATARSSGVRDPGIDGVDLLDLLVPAIRSLPPPLREVLVLRDVEGHSTAETAGRLGISEGNVKVRLHRARASLRAAFAGAEVA